MKTKSLRCIAVLATAFLCTVVRAQMLIQSLPPPDVQTQLEEARAAISARKYDEAQQQLQRLQAPATLTTLSQGQQYFTFLFSAYAADGSDDNLGAHEFIVRATSYPQTDGEDWVMRARLAATIDNWEDSGFALRTVLRRWPKSLTSEEWDFTLAMITAAQLRRDARLRGLRLELLNSMYEARYKDRWGDEPGHLWIDLVADALEQQDTARARAIAQRITGPSDLVTVRIDRRFDSLVAGSLAPIDVRVASERFAKRMRKTMGANPNSLGAVVQYEHSLYGLGRFDEIIALSDRSIAKVTKALRDTPPFEDIDRNLNWIYNAKANALRAQGKLDLAVAVLEEWLRSEHNTDDKVSQAINLGFYYNELAEPEAALKAIDGLDWTRGMSPYGRTQVQFVRFQAFQQLGKKDEEAEVVDWIVMHQDDAKETAQSTLLQSGDDDGAAALLISRLRDGDERPMALAQLQSYLEGPRTPRQARLDALEEKLLSREDVAAAIASVGRREKFPIYSLEY